MVLGSAGKDVASSCAPITLRSLGGTLTHTADGGCTQPAGQLTLKNGSPGPLRKAPGNGVKSAQPGLVARRV